jgi:hypothetical protein
MSGIQSGMAAPVYNHGKSARVGADATASWANSASANTEVDNDFPQPATITGKHVIVVHNPSAETALTGKAKIILTLGGTARQATIATFAVAAGETKAVLVEGLFRGADGVRVTLSNDTALGLAGAFTADLAIREA